MAASSLRDGGSRMWRGGEDGVLSCAVALRYYQRDSVISAPESSSAQPQGAAAAGGPLLHGPGPTMKPPPHLSIICPTSTVSLSASMSRLRWRRLAC